MHLEYATAALDLGVETYEMLLQKSDPQAEFNIEKDLARTFPDIDEFKESGKSGKNRLFNVLKAYSQFDPKVSYCQGLNYVAAILLLYIKQEELAFFTLVHIMHEFNWRTLYVENMPRLIELLRELSRLIKRHLPEIHEHLRCLEVHPNISTKS